MKVTQNYNKFKMFSGGLPITALLFFIIIGLCNNLGNFIRKSINSSSLKFSFLRLLFLYSSSPVLKISLIDKLSFNYGDRPVLNEINLVVPQGISFGILKENTRMN